jgi:hypothetical protein
MENPFATNCCERLYDVGDTGLERSSLTAKSIKQLRQSQVGGAAKSGAVGGGGPSHALADAKMWITRCKAVVDDFRGAAPGREKEIRQRASATLLVLGELRRAVVGAEKAVRALLKPAKRRLRS